LAVLGFELQGFVLVGALLEPHLQHSLLWLFVRWFWLLPWAGLDHNLPIYTSCSSWDITDAATTLLFLLSWVLVNFLPRVTWNYNSPDLSFPQSCVGRRELLCPTIA
jgi:hypothetical protein